MPPKSYPEWVEAFHQDWLREAEALGGLAFHTQYMEGWKIWDACVKACIHIMREEAHKARPQGHTT